jgi:hypothetical protein
VATDAMQSVFGMEPHAWQEQAMSHTIALAKDDTVGVILAGIVFTISPLLSLAADPTNKVDRRASQEFGNVVSFHLDEIKDRTEQLAAAASILNLDSNTTQTIFLFASPQAFVNNPVSRKLLDSIIQKKMLLFVAINEINLFVHFARYFHQEFAWLKPYLFSKLQSCGSASRTTVPVLFMNTTCNTTIVENVELLSGLQFHVANIFWPPLPGMQHRYVSFNICYSSGPLAVIQPHLKKLLSSNVTSKYIIYSNLCVMIEGIHSKLSLWLDTNNLHLFHW